MRVDRKPLIIYHSPCADGSGAAFAAWCKFGEEAEYRPAAAGDPAPPDEDVRDRDVYVLDLSYPMVDLRRMAAVATKVVMLDHHKTAFERLVAETCPGASEREREIRLAERRIVVGDTRLAIIVDLDHSGAVTAWQTLRVGVPVPEVLLYVEDRDLWRWQMHKSHEVSAVLDSYDVWEDFRRFKLYVDLSTKNTGGLDDFYELKMEGEAVLRMQSRLVDVIARTAETVTFHVPGLMAFNGEAACSAVLQSEVGHKLAKPGVIAAVWYRDGERGQYKVSLRSAGELDVTPIAEAHGGGGHRNAAGFYCDELPWKPARRR